VSLRMPAATSLFHLTSTPVIDPRRSRAGSPTRQAFRRARDAGGLDHRQGQAGAVQLFKGAREPASAIVA